MRAGLGADLLLALGALQIVEHDTRTVPLLLHLSLDTVEVHDVTAVEANAWLLTDRRTVANGAVVLSGARELWLFHFLDALGIEARQTSLLAAEAAAWVTTLQSLITTLLHHIEAFLLTAHVLERGLHTRRWLLELFLTEAALGQVLLIARLASVIRLSITLGTEVLAAAIASDTVSRQVLSGFLRERRALVVLLTLNHLTGHHLHDIIAAARNKVRVLFHNLLRLVLLDLCAFIRGKELVKLSGRNWSLATRTLDFLAVG